MKFSVLVRYALVVSLLAAPLAALAGIGPSVFINELHYDNGGTDANETVEIAGPTDTNLSGWSIVLYSGNGGGMYQTETLPLGTILPSTCGGDGVVVIAPGQIQNGAPDGLALVDAGGNVIQFLSYEGTFTATDGPASGMTSVDIDVAEDGGTTATESLQLSGSGSTYDDFAWNAPADATFGACNTNQTFSGTPVDNAPKVNSSTPTDGATGIAVDSDIVIQFSEAATVGASAVTLSCDSFAQAGVLSNTSSSSVSFNPNAAMPDGVSCTVTVDKDAVTDQDGTADPMAADYSFGFQTAGDIAPTVVSTNPPDGTGAYPTAGNLGVLFSEPVTLTTGWYSLSCDTSGSHTATQSGSGASYSLDPTADFSALENCTFTIVASAVYDLDGGTDTMANDVVVSFTVGPDSSNYYADVDTSSGPALEAWLHTRLTTTTGTPYSAVKAYPYTGSTTDTWDILSLADSDPANPVDTGPSGGIEGSGNILDLYKNASMPYVGGGQQNYNREHTWPQSLGFPDESRNSKPNPPHNDTHMLFLSEHSYNQKRGNGLLANCAVPANCTALWTVYTNGFGDDGSYTDLGNANLKNGDISFEVWDHRKGDVARAVMYMAVRYDGGYDAQGICEPDLKLTDNADLVKVMDAQDATGCTGPGNVAYNGLLTDLLQWNQLDPPDDAERLRNNIVYSFRHNRNPFVDHPEWAQCVFKNTNCPLGDLIFKNGFESAATAP